MGLLFQLRTWFVDRRERRQQEHNAARLDDPRIAKDALRHFARNIDAQEVVIDTAHGKARFGRKDVARLVQITKSSVGERVFAHAMMGGTAYGFPGGSS